LLNLSTRGRAETGDNVLIGGFILGGGTTNKNIIVRALGPSLGVFGVTPLLDPSLELFSSTGQLIGSNDNWQDDPNFQQVIDAGLAPTDSHESALFESLAPGAYTVVVTGVDGTQNIALVEIYDLDSLNVPQLLNISTRGFVDTGNAVMIAGVIVGGTTGQTIVVRGLGPSLATSVGSPLANPMLTIVSSLGVVLATNDDWQTDPNANAIIGLGLAPTNTFESATMISLLPGAYTAILSGVNSGTGIGLVEIYNVTNQ
jgi:hypothetical protein